MSQHIKDDEEYVHSEVSGSIQCDPLLESLSVCQFLHNSNYQISSQPIAIGARRSRRGRCRREFFWPLALITVSKHMTQWQHLWQQQCRIWIDSINAHKQHGSVSYDFDTHRLTLVPRTLYRVDEDNMDVPYRQLKPLMDTMDRALMEYEIKLDASYGMAPVIHIDRIHIYLDGAEAITQLALIVEPQMLRLKGGLRQSY